MKKITLIILLTLVAAAYYMHRVHEAQMNVGCYSYTESGSGNGTDWTLKGSTCR